MQISSQRIESHRNREGQNIHQKYPDRPLLSNVEATCPVSTFVETVSCSIPPLAGNYRRASGACAIRGQVVERKQHRPS